MEGRPPRPSTERDLRSLSTGDLLAAIQADIQELDRLAAVRRSAAREAKLARKAKLAEPPMVEDEPPDELTLHAVICCNHHMGDFPPIARVRCPFCGDWHRAGDFPSAS